MPPWPESTVIPGHIFKKIHMQLLEPRFLELEEVMGFAFLSMLPAEIIMVHGILALGKRWSAHLKLR